jgi:hypothetical protein
MVIFASRIAASVWDDPPSSRDTPRDFGEASDDSIVVDEGKREGRASEDWDGAQ